MRKKGFNKMRPIIVGDSLNNGGTVLTGRQNSEIDLDLFASIGDLVMCELHGEGSITEGAPNATIDGRPIALEGHKAFCGCKLIATKKRKYDVELDLMTKLEMRT